MKSGKLFLLFLLIFAASACGPLIGAKRAEESFFVIVDDGRLPGGTLPAYELRLLVRDAKANPFINSQKIIFSDSPVTRGYYQLARWVESPSDRFTLLLIDRFSRSRVFHTVSRPGSSALGDIQLNTELIEFYHDAREMPGRVLVRISAELVDLKRRTTVGVNAFEQVEAVKDYSAEGAVKAFSEAVNRVLDQIVIWTVQQAASLEREDKAAVQR